MLDILKLVLVSPSKTKGARIVVQSSADSDKIDTAANDILKDFGSDGVKGMGWPTLLEVMSKSHVSSRSLVRNPNLTIFPARSFGAIGGIIRLVL